MNFLRCCVAFWLLFVSACSGATVLLTPRAPIEIPGSRGGFGTMVVDDEKRLLLLAHTGNHTLDVLDLSTGKIIKQIKVDGATAVVVDAEKNRYYVGSGREKKIFILDRKQLEITGEVALPGPADSLAPGPVGVNRVFAAPASGTELWVVDAAAKKIASTVSLPDGITALISEDASSRLYASTTSDDSVQILSAADNNSTLGGAWPTAPVKKPQALALDPRGERRLFVAGVNGKLVMLAGSDGPRLGVVDIPTGVTQLALDPDLNRLYCPSSSGKLAVLDISGNVMRPLADVATARGAKSIAVDRKTHTVWLAYTDGGKCFVRGFAP